MRIHSVKLKGDPDPFGGRVLEVKTDKFAFRTPDRAVTSQEFQSKAKLPHEPALNNNISEVIGRFYKSDWDKFMETNGSFSSRLRTLEFYTDKMSYTAKRFFPNLSSEIKIDLSGIKLLLELQRMCNLDFITLPNLSADIGDFKKIVTDFNEEVLGDRREPLVYMDMELEPDIFRDRYLTLLKMAETGLVNSIGLTYRPIRDNVLNYRLIWTNRESNVFLQMSGVPREYRRKTPASTMHLLPKWGIDSYSVKSGSGYWGNGGKPAKPRIETLYGAKRLDPEPLLVQRFGTWAEKSTQLDCDCPVCKGKNIPEFIEAYDSVHESYPGEVFNAANRLHDHFKGAEELARAREYILDGELSEYFGIKEGLKSTDTEVPPQPQWLDKEKQ